MWKKIIIERVVKDFYEANELAQIGREGQYIQDFLKAHLSYSVKVVVTL